MYTENGGDYKAAATGTPKQKILFIFEMHQCECQCSLAKRQARFATHAITKRTR
jgi:hypothetical protein